MFFHPKLKEGSQEVLMVFVFKQIISYGEKNKRKVFALPTFFICVSVLLVFIDHLLHAGTGLKFCEHPTGNSIRLQ